MRKWVFCQILYILIKSVWVAGLYLVKHYWSNAFLTFHRAYQTLHPNSRPDLGTHWGPWGSILRWIPHGAWRGQGSTWHRKGHELFAPPYQCSSSSRGNQRYLNARAQDKWQRHQVSGENCATKVISRVIQTSFVKTGTLNVTIFVCFA